MILLALLAACAVEPFGDTGGPGIGDVVVPLGDAVEADDKGETPCPGTTRDLGWNSVYLSSGSTYSFEWWPWVSGTHRMDIIHSGSTSPRGTMAMAWASNASPTWTTWRTVDYTYNYVRYTLSSGSSDVRYRFTIRATSSSTFYWRFCQD